MTAAGFTGPAMGERQPPASPLALHKRLSAARGLLIEWRCVLRRSGPTGEADRPGFEREMARFDDAIKAVAEARDRTKP